MLGLAGFPVTGAAVGALAISAPPVRLPAPRPRPAAPGPTAWLVTTRPSSPLRTLGVTLGGAAALGASAAARLAAPPLLRTLKGTAALGARATDSSMRNPSASRSPPPPVATGATEPTTPAALSASVRSTTGLPTTVVDRPSGLLLSALAAPPPAALATATILGAAAWSLLATLAADGLLVGGPEATAAAGRPADLTAVRLGFRLLMIDAA